MENRIVFDIDKIRQAEKQLKTLSDKAAYLCTQLTEAGEEEIMHYEEVISIYRKLAESLAYASSQYALQPEVLLKEVNLLSKGGE